MGSDGFGLWFSIVLIYAISPAVMAGSMAGIVRTDGQPLETGPFESQASAEGPQITREFHPMYVIAQPNSWTKTFRWEIPANTGLLLASR